MTATAIIAITMAITTMAIITMARRNSNGPTASNLEIQRDAAKNGGLQRPPFFIASGKPNYPEDSP